MEKWISSSYKLPSFCVVGNNIQSLQIVLKYYEGLIINSQYLTYVSSNLLEETQYSKINNLINSYNQKANCNNYIRLKNKNNSIEYIGLTHLGKIIKINPLLYNDLIIREDSILCFNETLNLIEDDEIKKRINDSVNNQSFFNLMFQKKNFYLLKKSQSEKENLLSDIKSLLKDFIYISSNKNIMEKRLGENEEIIIMKNELLVFEKTITFSNLIKTERNQSTYVNLENDLICEGPGLIIFELNERKEKPIKFSKLMILSIIIILLYILEFILSNLLKQ